MKTVKYFALLTLLILAFSTTVYAAQGESNRADEWFMKERLKTPAPKNKKTTEDYIKDGQERLKAKETIERKQEIEKKEEKKERERKQKEIPRYIMLFSDDSFTYWLDTDALRWRAMPYSTHEDILDCWIKMENISDEKEYTYPETYYMEHLYLRPKRRQVMFLSELEVTGRPENNIKERTYKAEYWEELVPGSVEEEIYKGTLKVLEKLKKKNKINHPENGEKYDFFDEVLKIGGIF